MTSAFVSDRITPPRRFPIFPGSAVAVRVLTPQTISLIRDLAFAITTASIIWDIRSPVGHLPIFLIFSFVTLVLSAGNLIALSQSLRLFVPPLFIFICIHLTTAFYAAPVHLASRSNGIRYILQFFAVTAFVWPFAVRYSQTSMQNYLRFAGFFLFLTLMFVLGYHAAHHRYFSWKLLSRGKSIFDLLPIMLVILNRSKLPSSKLLFTIFLPIFLVLILVSGERKAYILLVFLMPLFINFKNPVIYIVPLVAAAALPLLLTVDHHGYVARQLNTLVGFGHGKVVHTGSNDERYFAVKLATKLFQENPIFGIGTNGYSLYVERTFYTSLGVHNDWLRVASENGVVGLFFYGLTVLYGFVGLFRSKVFGYVRSRNDKVIGYALFMTCLMYLTFEAYDYEVLIAFCTIPLIQFLRFSPDPSVQVEGAKRVATRTPRAPDTLTPATARP